MLTDKDYEYLIKATGDKEIQLKIESQESMELNPTKVHHFAEVDYNVLVDNLKSGGSKESYEQGKIVGQEKTIKEVRNQLKLNFEGVTVDNLISSINSTIELNKEGKESELRADYDNRISELQKTVESERDKYNDLLNSTKKEKINFEIDNFFNALEIEVPDSIKDEAERKKYIENEKLKNTLLFKSTHTPELDENGTLIFSKNGEIVRDEIQNPKRLNVLGDEFIKNNYIPIKKNIEGRGEGDRLPGQIAKFKTREELNEYAKKNNIRENTDEFDALVIEFNKNK